MQHCFLLFSKWSNSKLSLPNKIFFSEFFLEFFLNTTSMLFPVAICNLYGCSAKGVNKFKEWFLKLKWDENQE